MAYQGADKKIIFSKPPYGAKKIQLPCGQCIGCKLERARQWSVRIMHEASFYDENCFITLTYDEKHMPFDQGLRQDDLANFFKLLRYYIRPKKIKYFACGEYGEKMGRPHYHACIFGLDFQQKKNYNDDSSLTVDDLEKIWSNGLVHCGELTQASAQYVARYCTKKVYGPDKQNHYISIDPETGEEYLKRPEYVVMSRRPAIGKQWIDKYKKEVLRDDTVVMHGREQKPPRYYDKQAELTNPELLEKIKIARLARVKEQTRQRLLVKEKVAELTLKQRGTRRYENG